MSAKRSLLRNENGRPVAIVGAVRDITNLKVGEEALRQSEAKYRLLIENAGSPIFIVTRDGVFEMMNGIAARALGGEPEDFVGMTMWELFPPEVADRQMADVQRALDSWDVVVTEAGTVLQGQVVWFRTRLSPIMDELGRPSRVQAIAHDITDLKRAEQELLAHQQRLRTLTSELALAEERERRQIAADLHDHIGQALTIAAMKVGLLDGDPSAPDSAEALKEVAELIDRALHATRSLTFELSPPILYDLGLEPAVEWLVEQVQEEHGLQVSFADDGQSKMLDNDIRVTLFKAVRELLFNVVKHARARKAEVALSRSGDAIEVRIWDDGIGFDPSDGPAGRPGEGFGLFNIRERLRHLGGRLEIDSRPGHGTCVTLRAPLQAAPRAEKEGAEWR